MSFLKKIKKKISQNRLFKLFYAGWMKFARALGWVNTRIILSLVYYILFSGARTVLSLLGKDLLDRKIEKSSDTYWVEKDDSEKHISFYLKQF